MKRLKKIALHDAIYAAGLFDGEGCIGVYQRPIGPRGINPRHALLICVSSTHTGVLDHLKTTCGGTVYKPYVNFDKRPGRQPISKWSAHSREAGQILKAIAPYLVIKKEQALLAIEFADRTHAQLKGPRKQKQMLPLSAKDLAYRADVCARLKAMKRPHLHHAESNLTPQLSV